MNFSSSLLFVSKTRCKDFQLTGFFRIPKFRRSKEQLVKKYGQITATANQLEDSNYVFPCTTHVMPFCLGQHYACELVKAPADNQRLLQEAGGGENGPRREYLQICL